MSFPFPDPTFDPNEPLEGNAVKVHPCESLTVAVENQFRTIVLVLHSSEFENMGFGAPAIMFNEKSAVSIIARLQSCLNMVRLLPLPEGDDYASS